MQGACLNGHFDVAELLIDAGAYVNVADEVSVILIYLEARSCTLIITFRFGLLFSTRHAGTVAEKSLNF